MLADEGLIVAEETAGKKVFSLTESGAGNEYASVPRVVWDLTTRRMLTLEDVSAIKLGDYS